MAAEDTTYILESEEEISRLSNQHDVIVDALGGQLVLAPLDLSNQPLRILDSATADGTWIRHLAEKHPSVQHEFIGTDIDASNWPKPSPPNQSYQNQDMTKPWPAEWKGSFDFVHQRLALAAGGAIQEQIVANLVDLVKPGGYIQLIEAFNMPHPSHGPSFQNFISLIKAAYTAFNGSLILADDIPRWLENVGIVDIASRDIDLKLGALNPDPRLARQGAYSTTVAAKGLSQFALNSPAGTVQLTKEEVESHPDELRKELLEKGAVYQIRAVWGRKPL